MLMLNIIWIIKMFYKIENEGRQSRKIFENLSKMFNRLKIFDKIDTKLTTLKSIQ
jgi:hypothetical protein